MPGVRPQPEAPPRPLIARFLNFQDRDLILRELRKKGEIKYENTRVMVFPDYSRDVQKLRRTFDPIKVKLCALGIRYMLLFPVKLKVIFQDTTHFFQSPEEVWSWIEEKPRLKRGSPSTALLPAGKQPSPSCERPKEKRRRRVLKHRISIRTTTGRSLRLRDQNTNASDTDDDTALECTSRTSQRSSGNGDSDQSERHESLAMDNAHPLLEKIQQLQA